MIGNKKNNKSFLIKGPIKSRLIGNLIRKHETKTDLGAHVLFLGQVRSDGKGKKKVREIIYSSYGEMAEKEFQKIKDEAFDRYPLRCMHIYHSKGKVKAGEVSLMIMVSAWHREKTFEALKFVVEQIKKRVPIWKKEVFDDGSAKWVGK